MARLSAGALAPVAAVLLAVVAWIASPQSAGVLDDAAAALEEAGVVRFRTELQVPGGRVADVAVVVVDHDRDVTVVEAPQQGVARRLVVGDDVYELLAGGTWIRLPQAPERFGQDPAALLRDLEGRVVGAGRGRYRIALRGGTATLELGPDGLPRRFESRYRIGADEARAGWQVLGVGGRVDARPPARARAVSAAEYQELVAWAASRESRNTK